MHILRADGDAGSLKALDAVEMLQEGTQISVSHHLARGMIFFISSANFLVSDAVMFIFQLPAMMVLRYLQFMLFFSFYSLSSRSAKMQTLR
jgi:hypothetical protein